jgi:hypothetical protein
MSMPPDDAVPAQILIKLGEMGAQLAVITEQLKDIPDHEARLRVLERARWPLPTVALVVSAGAGVGAWVAALHH